MMRDGERSEWEKIEIVFQEGKQRGLTNFGAAPSLASLVIEAVCQDYAKT